MVRCARRAEVRATCHGLSPAGSIGKSKARPAPTTSIWASYGLAVEIGGSGIERYRKLQKASARSGIEAGSRQLAELARQFTILGAGAMQCKRVFMRHMPVNGGE